MSLCLYVSLCCRQQKVDVTITTMRSGVVRVEDSEESLYASIDLVSDKIARKLKKVIRAVLQLPISLLQLCQVFVTVAISSG
jgi:ribosomal subunit interface protein